MSALHESIASEFTAARGREEDGRWAEQALSRLLLDDVRPGVAGGAVREVLPVVTDSGESPHDLFGDPLAWAVARCARWREEGGDVGSPPEPTTPRGVVVGALAGASIFTAMFLLVSALGGDLTLDYGPALVLLPLLLSAGVLTSSAVYETVKIRRSFRVAVLTGGVFVVTVSAAIAGAVFAVRDVVVVERSVFWMVPLVLGWAGLAWVVGRLWPRRRTGAFDGSVAVVWSDDAWFAELAHELRRRDDMSDVRVDEILRESRDHAAESGDGVAVEFGSPRAYAARFERNDRVAARRSAFFWTVLTLLPVSLLMGDLVEGDWRWSALDPWTVAWAAVVALLAAFAWRSLARVGSGRG